MKRFRVIGLVVFLVIVVGGPKHVCAQHEPNDEVRRELQEAVQKLQQRIGQLQADPELQNREGRQHVADVAIFAKAVEWQLRFREFPKKDFLMQARRALQLGWERAKQLESGMAAWTKQVGSTVRGYVSDVDDSVQPYALTLPKDWTPDSRKRWPLYVKLHGRANTMNETNFIQRHEAKAAPDDQTWIQLDVYGRGNNAYRWAGETDVFEAIRDVQRRYRIDNKRVTLHGFSMGGAGAWHLGLHHPDRWSSMGAGAGFVDFYRYQKQTEKRPVWQDENLRIYDTVNYAVNAFNLPVIGYGGENDSQLATGQMMKAAAAEQGVEIPLLIGPDMGHKFDPQSLNTFMQFHADASKVGRPGLFGRPKIRFVTHTLKYNRCDWLTIHEVDQVYSKSEVNAEVTESGTLTVTTENVTAFSINRDVARQVIIDGADPLPGLDAAEGLLPDVYYVKRPDGWDVLSYQDSRLFAGNPDRNKRHNLQGPIDDAFMSRFVCVRPTGEPWSVSGQDWSDWTFARFQTEFDQWMRARVPVVDDLELSEEQIQNSHLVLFGDPSSNAVLKEVVADLPIEWTKDSLKVNGQSFDAGEHGLSMIFPNPKNPSKYIVINSGHTFHGKDFKASNSWLFPRLGDIAVQKFQKTEDGFEEQTVFAANFNSNWQWPSR